MLVYFEKPPFQPESHGCLRVERWPYQTAWKGSLLSQFIINIKDYLYFQCQGLLNEVVLDQLPPLIDLKHFLGALPVESSRFDKKTNLVFEELPQIKENLEIKAEKEGGYMKIANQQSEIFLTTDSQQISSLAQKLSSAYNTDVLAEFDEPSSKDPQTEDNKSCKVCQKAAEKKCGNCSKAFYCSKDCQVKHWPIHKKVCLQE